ncbi:Nif11-like leader peptide family natural product precursor [Crocosphaera sp. XPORK-15E]|uniref:Nif11-like leader peptide family natural product precursor n=1 Tax=Crocosphaera sp. XPORK-15E TaxID=3110247 RepID=UPI002B1FE6E5|nr:Nif11-like leader peptide family natural product precursor [Crocosphaera sp. XPORK-15E]MEA5535812.1 Nif11-like leader peptide family natural product precursor [Crocosphaera sp. XPORK-15E]
MSLAHVKSFYEQLANDEAFRTQIQNVETKEQCSQIVKAAGYDFTLEEYEEYTYQLLESAAGEGEIQDLGEKELAAVFGGMTGRRTIQPLYGVIWPPKDLYAQPLYGVVISTDE